MITPPSLRDFIALVAATTLAAPVLGQTPPVNDATHVSVELDSGWTLESAIVNDGLVGFFAWIPQAEVTAGNVYMAWIEHVGDGAWVMYGWDNGTSADAVHAIETELGNTTALDGVSTLEIDNSRLTTTDPCGGGGIQPGGPGGVAMPSGVTVTDPSAPLVAAVAGDPPLATAVVNALTASGASAAPDLSQMLVRTSLCPGVAEFDAAMTSIALGIQTETTMQVAGVNDPTAIAAVAGCWPCFPWVYRVYISGWTPWSCTGVTATLDGCDYTGCTRTRRYYLVSVRIDCSTVLGPIVTETEGPRNLDGREPNCDGSCPDNPS